MSTSDKAVATSLRDRRLVTPMERAAATANEIKPTSGLMPRRLAPAAPAKAPLGIACAAKEAARSTTKNPTTPASTATIVPLSHALVMKLENMVSATASRRGATNLPLRPRGDLAGCVAPR